jgi:hypothetical protein
LFFNNDYYLSLHFFFNCQKKIEIEIYPSACSRRKGPRGLSATLGIEVREILIGDDEILHPLHAKLEPCMPGGNLSHVSPSKRHRIISVAVLALPAAGLENCHLLTRQRRINSRRAIHW